MGDLLNEVLTENGLNSMENCTSKIPIIVQSYELPALYKYESLSDLPLVYLMKKTDAIDFLEVSKIAHGVGVGPKSEWLIDPNAPTNT